MSKSSWLRNAKLTVPKITIQSPFYRVTAKAVVLDDQARLLVVKNKNGHWELPGGGWEHEESFEECLGREIYEELGVTPAMIGDVYLVYRGINLKRGFMTLRLAAPVTLKSHDFDIGEDIQEAQFVSREEFLQMDFVSNEGDVADYVDTIWPPAA